MEADVSDDHVLIYRGGGYPARCRGVAVDLGYSYVPQPAMLDKVRSQRDAGDGRGCFEIVAEQGMERVD